jgi:acetoin utilization protein AcuB
MRVADGLRRPAASIAPEGSLADAERLMERHGVRHLGVVRDGRLVGLVTWDDLAAARPSPATTLTAGEIRSWLASIAVEQVMRRDPPVVAPDTPLADAARLLREWNLGVLPVVQEGELVGLLTELDAVGLLGVAGRR